jgi:DNA-binding transcriptional ArsR family regulator
MTLKGALKERSPSRKSGEHTHRNLKERQVSVASRNRAVGIFRALGDASRLRLLELLAQSECCVTELVDALGEKFSTTSQRLRILRAAGLIRRRRDRTHIFYALADRHVADLVHNALEHADELEAKPAREEDAPKGG